MTPSSVSLSDEHGEVAERQARVLPQARSMLRSTLRKVDTSICQNFCSSSVSPLIVVHGIQANGVDGEWRFGARAVYPRVNRGVFRRGDRAHRANAASRSEAGDRVGWSNTMLRIIRTGPGGALDDVAVVGGEPTSMPRLSLAHLLGHQPALSMRVIWCDMRLRSTSGPRTARASRDAAFGLELHEHEKSALEISRWWQCPSRSTASRPIIARQRVLVVIEPRNFLLHVAHVTPMTTCFTKIRKVVDTSSMRRYSVHC